MKSNLNEGFVKALPPDGLIGYYPSWVEIDRANGLLHRLRNDLNWQSRTIQLFGRRVLQPRLIHFQGDAGICYRYSGSDYLSEAWHPDVLNLRNQLKDFVLSWLNIVEQKPQYDVQFNSVLINRYRDGQDSMGWHADNEKSLGRNPLIASISFGATRRFILRTCENRQHRFEMLPEHGSLILMAGDLQHHWQHELPKTQKHVAERINLTFRTVLA